MERKTLATPDCWASSPSRWSARRLARQASEYWRQVRSTFINAAQRWFDDDCGTLAAAVAYYLALSLFPLLMLALSVFGLFLKYTHLGQDAEQQLLAIVAEHCSPTLELQIQRLLRHVRDQSIASGPIGLVAALITAMGVFYQFERSMDRIWRVTAHQEGTWWSTIRRIINQRIVAFCLMLGVGAALIAITFVGVVLGAVRQWMSQWDLPGTVAIAWLDAFATVGLNAAAFGVLYRSMPRQPVTWREAMRAGLLVAILWEAGRQILAACLIRSSLTTYGAIGSFVAVLLWFYWGVALLLFGAEYLHVLAERRFGSARHQRPTVRLDDYLPSPTTASPARPPGRKIRPRRAA